MSEAEGCGMTDVEKLHRIKLLAQEWFDNYDGYDSGPDIEDAAMDLLSIVDPDNQRLKPKWTAE